MSETASALRSTQRAPRNCIECTRRKVKCRRDDLSLPCTNCRRRGVAHLCRREVVKVRGVVIGNEQPPPPTTNLWISSDIDDAPRIERSPPFGCSALEPSKSPETIEITSMHHSLPTRHRENSPQESDIVGFVSRAKLPASLPSIRDLFHRDGSVDSDSENSPHSTSNHDHGLLLSAILPPLQRQSIHVNEQRNRANLSPSPPSDHFPSTACYFPSATVTHHARQAQTDTGQSPTTFFQECLAQLNTIPQKSPNVRSGQAHPNDVDLVPTHDPLDEHILLYIIFFGWAATRSQFKLENYWDGVQKIHDHYGYESLDKLQVLSMMDFVLAIVKSLHNTGTKSLPGFAFPTEVEQSIKHDVMVRFFPWPGMRNQMVMNLDPFIQPQFTKDFHSAASFLFPSLNDAFFFDLSTNRFAFTTRYRECRNDLTCYTCTGEFLHKYPMLQGSIPVSTASARKLQPVGQASGLGLPALLNERRKLTNEIEKLKAAAENEDHDDATTSRKIKRMVEVASLDSQ